MKTCTLCKLPKPLSEFNKKASSKDGLQNKCRECSKLAAKRHYEENAEYYLEKNQRHREEKRLWLEQLKDELKCQNCGESEPCCLDFHHLDPQEKDFTVSQAASWGYSTERIQVEIEKCVILCANCHRKYHKGLIHIAS